MLSLLAVTVTQGVHVIGPAPYVAVGGEVGLARGAGRTIETGVEGEVFWYVPGQTAAGLNLGAYVRVAPIPGDWGRRFYLTARAGRSLATGTPTLDAFRFGGGLGYRHPLDPGLVYVEAGLERAYLFKYDEVDFLVDFARAGFTW